MEERMLPEGFEELIPWVDWALPHERERKAKRVASTPAEIDAFYQAMFSRLEDAIRHCDQFRYDALPPDARRLADMSLSLVEVCNLVELYKGPDVMDAMAPSRFVPYE